MTPTTTYWVRDRPAAPQSAAVPVDDPADAEYLARRGYYVTAETRGGA
jgi:hypothetical protein